MKTLISVIIGLPLTLTMSLHAQEIYKFNGWDESVLRAANTGAGAEFLTDDERKVIVLANMARTDGPLFAETIMKEYIIMKELRSNRYIKSLYRDLKKIKGVPMLVPERDLYRVARDHATKMGVRGREGHQGFKNRYTPLMERYMEVGENIYYGKYTPEEIIMQLLIDEGIEDLGHRKNLLNPRFNSIGVSIKPHKEYQYNCVMSFGLYPRSYEDYIQ
jgi:hypothetical protein